LSFPDVQTEGLGKLNVASGLPLGGPR
jgi:hypothetical protein